MKIFLDTSALAKRYVQEPGSEELEELFSSVATEVFVSTLAFVEFAAAMGRKLRSKEIAKASARKAIRELEKDWYDLFVKISWTENLAESAASIALQYSLKGADAVHLALFKEVSAELFIASDNQLIQTAKKMGMHPYNPESGIYKP